MKMILSFNCTSVEIEKAAMVVNLLQMAEIDSPEDIEYDSEYDNENDIEEDSDEDYWSIDRWFSRLGENSRRFWMVAANYMNHDGEFTIAELAEATGIEVKNLQSAHRNSYRAIKAADAPDPLLSHFDAERRVRVYRMLEAVRDEILGWSESN